MQLAAGELEKIGYPIKTAPVLRENFLSTILVVTSELSSARYQTRSCFCADVLRCVVIILGVAVGIFFIAFIAVVVYIIYTKRHPPGKNRRLKMASGTYCSLLALNEILRLLLTFTFDLSNIPDTFT